MIEEPKEDPAKRLRKLTGSGSSPLTRLPKMKEVEVNEVENEAASIRQKLTPVNQPTQLPPASKPDPKPAAVSTNSFFWSPLLDDCFSHFIIS